MRPTGATRVEHLFRGDQCGCLWSFQLLAPPSHSGVRAMELAVRQHVFMISTPISRWQELQQLLGDHEPALPFQIGSLWLGVLGLACRDATAVAASRCQTAAGMLCEPVMCEDRFFAHRCAQRLAWPVHCLLHVPAWLPPDVGTGLSL